MQATQQMILTAKAIFTLLDTEFLEENLIDNFEFEYREKSTLVAFFVILV